MYQNHSQYSGRSRGWGPRQNFSRGRGNQKHFRGNQFKQFSPRFQHYHHFNPNNQYEGSAVNMRYQPYSAKNHHYQEYGSGDHSKYGSCFSKSSQGKTQGINKVQVEAETPDKISVTTAKENQQSESVLERKHWKPSDDFAVKPKKSEKPVEKRQWRPADDFNQPPKTKLDDLMQLSKKTVASATNTSTNAQKKNEQFNTNMSNSTCNSNNKTEEQFYFNGKTLTTDNFVQVMGSKKSLTPRQKEIYKIYSERLKAKQRREGTTPPILCGLCGKIFPKMKELVHHLKKDEIKSNMFSCPVCRKWRESVNRSALKKSSCFRINKHVIKCRQNSKGYQKMVKVNIEWLDIYYDTDTDDKDSDEEN